MQDYIITGGISGGIYEPDSIAAIKHAELYYEEIRHMTTDVKNIVNNTSFTDAQILLVKSHLFTAEHNLNGTIKKFDPSFEIAESWRRLAFDRDNIQPHDITLIKHELKELTLMAQGVSQEQAHIIASNEFNYTKESMEYYEKKGIKLNKSINKTSGAITIKSSELDTSDYTRW